EAWRKPPCLPSAPASKNAYPTTFPGWCTELLVTKPAKPGRNGRTYCKGGMIMASYRGHLAVSASLGIAYGAAGFWHRHFDWGPALLGAELVALGGLLPDVD